MEEIRKKIEERQNDVQYEIDTLFNDMYDFISEIEQEAKNKTECKIKEETEQEGTEQEGILTKKEKKYLNDVVYSFKEKVLYFQKIEINDDYECLILFFEDINKSWSSIRFPLFEKNKYYKNMELNKKYWIKEKNFL